MVGEVRWSAVASDTGEQAAPVASRFLPGACMREGGSVEDAYGDTAPRELVTTGKLALGFLPLPWGMLEEVWWSLSVQQVPSRPPDTVCHSGADNIPAAEEGLVTVEQIASLSLRKGLLGSQREVGEQRGMKGLRGQGPVVVMCAHLVTGRQMWVHPSVSLRLEVIRQRTSAGTR